MALKLSAEQKSIEKIFGTGMRYLIPNYQRPYSWNLVNCSDLWDDLTNFFEQDNYKDGYFLGNIVLAKSPETDFYEVVDGQQRLITITLIVKALHLYDINNNALNEIMWIPDRRSANKDQRLISAVFADKDNEYLLACLNIDNKNNINKHISKFHENLEFFCTKIEEKFQATGKVSTFADFVLDNVFLLPIQSDDSNQDYARDNALTIFETINNRGLDLSDADIFKAQIYMGASNVSKKDEFISRWNTIVERVEAIQYKVDDAFRVYMHVIRGKNKDSDSEMGLRQFFTTGNKYTKALKKQEYETVLNDLEKVVGCLEYFHRLVMCKYENNSEAELSKWFQIIHEYSNGFPKYATYVYLFQHGQIQDNTYIFPTNQHGNLIDQSQNIIRYVYSMGATSNVKTKVFEIIKNIFLDIPFKYIVDKNNMYGYQYFGTLRKGFLLLYIYFNSQQQPIEKYQFDRIVKKETPDNNINIDSIGNYLIVDETSFYYRNRSSDIRKQHFEVSQINDLKEVALELDLWDSGKQEARKTKINQKLMNFFQAN